MICAFFVTGGQVSAAEGFSLCPRPGPSGCRAGEWEQNVPSAPEAAPQILASCLGTAPPSPRFPGSRGTARLEGLGEAFLPPRDARQQAVRAPGMTGHLGAWLAVVCSCGKASDDPESPNGLCLAVSSAQALSSVFLPGADARWRLTRDELAKRARSASRSDEPRLCPLNLSVAGTRVAVGATLVTWAGNTGSPLQPATADILMLCRCQRKRT